MKIAEVESLVGGGGHFVRITTDSGLVGLGQSACWGFPSAVHEVVQTFREYLLGKDPLRIEHHWQYQYRMGPFRGSILSGAVSAVDIALWDIKGQHFQAPIWQLLGGACRDKIRLHLLMGGGSPEMVHAKATAAAAEGFTAIKFDPIPDGFQDMSLAALIAGTVDQVAAAREAVGKDVDIVLELHRKLTPLQAIPLCDALVEFRPLLIEDPIQIDSIQSQAEIAKRVTCAIANGERMHNVWEFRELLVAGGARHVRIDPCLAGGLSSAKKIAGLAEAFHAGVIPHGVTSPVGTAVSVQLDACIPNFVVQDYLGDDLPPKSDLLVENLVLENGYLIVPERPGIGVELKPGIEKQYPPIRRVIETELHEDGSVADR